MSIEVECYSGRRADERPLRFRAAGRRVEVRRVVRQWREPDAELFEVDGEDGLRYRLRHGRRGGGWTLDAVAGPSPALG